MPDSSSPAIAQTSPSAAWQCLTALALFLASIVIGLSGYLALAAPGPWLDTRPSLQWTAAKLRAARGTAEPGRAGLVVTAADASHSAIVALDTSFRARDYLAVAWDVSGVPDNVQATLLWYSDVNSSRVFRRPLTVDSGHIAPAIVDGEPHWLGRIVGLALLIEGDFAEPIVVHSVTVKPMSALQVLADTARGWLAFEPWTGASINGLHVASERGVPPLSAALAAVAGLASLLYAGLAWWKPHRFGAGLGAGLAVIVLAGWAVADSRWQWNLAQQARATLAQYGGKSWEERHLAAEDGALFGFIEKVREKLPPPPARVFMAAELQYFRARGAYHLYPYDVYYDPSSPALPPAGVMHAGDYVAVFRHRGVQYDAAAHRLRWEGQPPLSAELLLLDSGSALFQIR